MNELPEAEIGFFNSHHSRFDFRQVKNVIYNRQKL